MSKKHIIIVHGRHLKPSFEDKKRMVKKAISHGLNRLDDKRAYQDFQNGDVKFTLVYYGDINNKLMLQDDNKYEKELTNEDLKYGTPCEDAAKFDIPLERLFEQKKHTESAYENHIDKVSDNRGFDEIASVVSWFSNLTGLSEKIIENATPDMGAYLMRHKVGSEVRERLQKPLKKAILAGDDICLLAHSMGCIVSYDVLWKFSQMSEYRKIMKKNNPVTNWITIGNPLGEAGVRKNLYDANEFYDGRYHRGIVKNWLNISAVDDFVAHDSTIKDDFKEMKKNNYVNSIRDIKNLYNFWVGDSGDANPHKLYGYLDNPVMAKQLASWING